VPEPRVPLRLAGVLHAMADGIKMVWKEDFVPKNADKLGARDLSMAGSLEIPAPVEKK